MAPKGNLEIGKQKRPQSIASKGVEVVSKTRQTVLIIYKGACQVKCSLKDQTQLGFQGSKRFHTLQMLCCRMADT
jgi:hypothetical protein